MISFCSKNKKLIILVLSLFFFYQLISPSIKLINLTEIISDYKIFIKNM